MIKSKVDENQYFNFQLENSLNVLLVHNPILTKTSCALSVKIGSLNEPEEYPGLAHFLEHVLFMGTKKYPEENNFSKFISYGNGSTNAYTAQDVTVYYCDIDVANSESLFDRFASFFNGPLFMQGSVSREISAVHSEYINSRSSPYWRTEALLKELMQDNRKEKLFNIGSDETLRKEGILAAVKDFWLKNYSSDKMNLVVSTSLTLEEFKPMIQGFSEISRIIKPEGENPASFVMDSSACLFKPEYFGKIIQFAPKDEKKELNVILTIPSLRNRYEENPLGFISFAISSSEKGRFISKLKSAKLGFNISFTYEHLDEYTKITISVDLTEKGSLNHKKVLQMLYESLLEIRPIESEYNRLTRIKKEEFDYFAIDNPLTFVEELVTRMYYYPIEKIIAVDYTFDKYDSELINLVIGYIIDTSRWIITLADKEGVFKHIEKYYEVEYNEIGDFKAVRPTEISLINPTEDKFLDNIEFLKGEREVRHEVFDNGKLTFIFDADFKVPKGEISLILSSPEMEKNEVALEIFLRLAEDYFIEKYCRMFINYHLHIDLKTVNKKVRLRVTGFSSEIINVIKFILDEIVDIPLSRFDVIKNELEDEYIGVLSKSPFYRMSEVFANSLIQAKSSEEFLEEVRITKKEDMRFPKSFYTEVVAVGNLKYEEVLSLYKSIENKSPGLDYHIKLLDSISFKTPDQFNTLVGLYFKVNDYKPEFDLDLNTNFDENISPDYRQPYLVRSVIGRFIHTIGQERFFDQLRTKEELGYVVSSGVKTYLSSEFLVFYVQSLRDKEFLVDRISKFIDELKDLIINMDEDEFEAYRESLLGFYEEPILSLEELTAYVRHIYSKSRVDLSLRKKYIAIAETITKEDLIDSKILDKFTEIYSIKI